MFIFPWLQIELNSLLLTKFKIGSLIFLNSWYSYRKNKYFFIGNRKIERKKLFIKFHNVNKQNIKNITTFFKSVKYYITQNIYIPIYLNQNKLIYFLFSFYLWTLQKGKYQFFIIIIINMIKGKRRHFFLILLDTYTFIFHLYIFISNILYK